MTHSASAFPQSCSILGSVPELCSAPAALFQALLEAAWLGGEGVCHRRGRRCVTSTADRLFIQSQLKL